LTETLAILIAVAAPARPLNNAREIRRQDCVPTSGWVSGYGSNLRANFGFVAGPNAEQT
jgi:hypothetical protein